MTQNRFVYTDDDLAGITITRHVAKALTPEQEIINEALKLAEEAKEPKVNRPS